VLVGDGPDELHDEHGFPHPRSAKKPNFPAFRNGSDEVDHLDPSLEDLVLHGELFQGRRIAVDGVALFRGRRREVVDGVPHKVEHSSQGFRAHGHGNRATGVVDFIAPPEAIRGIHGDCAHRGIAKMLSYFQNQILFLPGNHEGLAEGRKMPSWKSHIHHRAADGHDPSFGNGFAHAHTSSRMASAPPMMSMSSRVMLCWRALLYWIVSFSKISSALSVAVFMAWRRAACSEGLGLEEDLMDSPQKPELPQFLEEKVQIRLYKDFPRRFFGDGDG
jgi:hypothetical protein